MKAKLMAQKDSEGNLAFKLTDKMQRLSDLMKAKVMLVPHTRKKSQLLRVTNKIFALVLLPLTHFYSAEKGKASLLKSRFENLADENKKAAMVKVCLVFITAIN
jgi:hypothetical protein